MSYFQSPNFLRNVLRVDAATCAITGALMAGASGEVGRLTGVPRGLLLWAGIGLLPIAVFIATVAAREALSKPAVWLVIAGNALWVAGSVWLIFGGSISPNAVGIVFIAAQALVVALLAELEFSGIRRLAMTT